MIGKLRLLVYKTIVILYILKIHKNIFNIISGWPEHLRHAKDVI